MVSLRERMNRLLDDSLFRSFSLPAVSDTEKIKAEFHDGLLTIEVPKPEQHKPKQIKVNLFDKRPHRGPFVI